MTKLTMSTTATTIQSKTIGTRKDIKYEERRAVRVITTNNDDAIIIIYAKKDSHYKLLGSGIEAEECHGISAKREALEETGCEVRPEVVCIAEVEEWRNDLHHFSYCYVASIVEDTGLIELTEEEVGDGLGLTHE
jgi:8-oxo-dGTP pyrophosphatase MutT (NUDIX family)